MVSRLAGGPVMQSGGVEVSSIRPHESPHLWIDFDGGEELGISKGTIELALENLLEVDDLCTAVIKADSQAMVIKDIH